MTLTLVERSEPPPPSSSPPIVAPPEASRPMGTRVHLAPLALGAFAFLLCVAWSSRVQLAAVTLRSALLLAVLGPGLVGLAVLARRRDRAAVAGAAFLLVAALSTLLAREPLMALFGDYFTRHGLLFLAACIGVWALARLDSAGAAPVLRVALLAGAATNAAVAWLQVSTDLGIRGLVPADGRAFGLLDNPVFLASLCAAATWIALDWERRARRPIVPLLVTGFLVGAVQLSGARSGLLAVSIAGAWFAAVHVRARRWGRVGGVVAAIALGLVLSLVPAGGDGAATARLHDTGTGGLGPRLAVWDAGLDSVADEPLLGTGPGRFSEASSPRRHLSSVRYEGRDVLLGDAHNLAVEIAATTGLLGFAAFAAWLVLAGRRARGALAGFAALTGLMMLLEPLNLVVTPLACLALAAATLPGTVPPRPGTANGRALFVGVALGIVGLVLGLGLVSGDIAFARGVRDRSLADVRAAAELSPPWPQYTGVRAQILAGQAADASGAAQRDEIAARALAAQRDTRGRDEADPRAAYTLGLLEEQWGSVARARDAYRDALGLNPWSYTALTRLYVVEVGLGHRSAALDLRARLCALDRADCPPLPEVIERMEGNPTAHPAGR